MHSKAGDDLLHLGHSLNVPSNPASLSRTQVRTFILRAVSREIAAQLLHFRLSLRAAHRILAVPSQIRSGCGLWMNSPLSEQLADFCGRLWACALNYPQCYPLVKPGGPANKKTRPIDLFLQTLAQGLRGSSSNESV